MSIKGRNDNSDKFWACLTIGYLLICLVAISIAWLKG